MLNCSAACLRGPAASFLDMDAVPHIAMEAAEDAQTGMDAPVLGDARAPPAAAAGECAFERQRSLGNADSLLPFWDLSIHAGMSATAHSRHATMLSAVSQVVAHQGRKEISTARRGLMEILAGLWHVATSLSYNM